MFERAVVLNDVAKAAVHQMGNGAVAHVLPDGFMHEDIDRRPLGAVEPRRDGCAGRGRNALGHGRNK